MGQIPLLGAWVLEPPWWSCGFVPQMMAAGHFAREYSVDHSDVMYDSNLKPMRHIVIVNGFLHRMMATMAIEVPIQKGKDLCFGSHRSGRKATP